MARRAVKQSTGERDKTVQALGDALRERSARQLAEADDPALPATGTTRISRLLAEARAVQRRPGRIPLGPHDG